MLPACSPGNAPGTDRLLLIRALSPVRFASATGRRNYVIGANREYVNLRMLPDGANRRLMSVKLRAERTGRRSEMENGNDTMAFGLPGGSDLGSRNSDADG